MNEIILDKKHELTHDEIMDNALNEAWADEAYLANWLVEIADNAYTMTPKWDPYPDYSTRLQALKEIRKIKVNRPDVQVNIQNVFSWAWQSL